MPPPDEPPNTEVALSTEGSSAGVAARVPLYSRVEADLRRRIRSSELVAGTAIPSEFDLARNFGVSRHTVRTALALLEADGLIERGAGRGTFVLPQPDRVRFYLDRSFSQQMTELGRRPRSRVLRAELGVLTDEDPQPLRSRTGAACFRLTRLRIGDDEPIGVQHTAVLTGRCPGVEAHDFASESLYAILAQEYELVVREIQHTIGAAVADPRQAELLGISTGDPLLVADTVALLEDREVLEHTTSHYRADRYEYSTRHVF